MKILERLSHKEEIETMETYSIRMKMAELLEANYHLLSVFSRLGLDGSFGEKTVDEFCTRSGLDADTFILLCEVYSFPDIKPSLDRLRRCHISDVMRYIHQSHDYYLNEALVSLASEIGTLIVPCTPAQQKVIWKFFTDYKEELVNHFEYEEGKVIPYVQNLMIGQRTPDFSMDVFEENHTAIDEALSDLRNLVMKSLPECCDNAGRMSLLDSLFHLQTDLRHHTGIEDDIFMPMVRLLEDPKGVGVPASEGSDPDPEGHGELSEREKEILVSVARGLINKEIADKHNISVNTVITHRKNITRKTGIKTVAGLTVYAILNGLVDINTVE